MATPLLTDDELNAALKDLPDWVRAGAEITRTVEAATFPAGIELVRRVASAAEAANHHPDIDIRWRRVTLTLSTHSAGGLTGLDISLAHEIDRLARES
jgi:4a-hydroxytetrahydrobiopterin dehydratase